MPPTQHHYFIIYVTEPRITGTPLPVAIHSIRGNQLSEVNTFIPAQDAPESYNRALFESMNLCVLDLLGSALLCSVVYVQLL